MRLTTTRRPGLLVLAALAGVTCTDAPTAPRAETPARAARLALAPSFSPAAVQAFGAMKSFGFTITNVRVVLHRPGGGVAIDTIVPVASGQSEIVLQLSVPVLGAQSEFDALVQLRDGTRVLFEGTQRVVAVLPGTTPGAQPPAPVIPIDYVGPGAAARSVRVAPRDTALATGVTLAFAAQALDAGGQRVGDAVIGWSVSDPALASIGTDGAFTAGTRRGAVRVRAMLPNGVGDSITVRVVPPPSTVVLLSGAGQSGIVGAALAQPVVVEVRAADGVPSPGVPVTVTASEGATATAAAAVTDAAGRASVQLTLGRTARQYTVTITAGTLTPVTVTATAVAGAASRIVARAGSGQRGEAGARATEPLVVLVTDDYDNPVRAAGVSWAVSTGSGRVSAASGTTGDDGTASAGYTYGTRPGTETVTATLAGTPGDAASAQRSATFFLTVVRATGPQQPPPAGDPTPPDSTSPPPGPVPDPPGGPSPPSNPSPVPADSVTELQVVHGQATGDPADHRLVAVRALAGQRPVPGITVRWTVVEGPFVIDAASATSVTDAEGIARMTVAPRGATGNGASHYRVRAEVVGNGAVSVEVRSVDPPSGNGRVAATPGAPRG